jgi:hypothetical protein
LVKSLFSDVFLKSYESTLAITRVDYDLRHGLFEDPHALPGPQNFRLGAKTRLWSRISGPQFEWGYGIFGTSDGIGIPQSRLEDHARLYNSSRFSQIWIAEAWIF